MHEVGSLDPPADADAGASAPPTDEAEATPAADGDAAPQSAQAKRIADAIASLEKSYAREDARWTDELRAQTTALVAADYPDTAAALDAILASPHRVPGNPERDVYRHPKETLLFFGIRPDMTVVEMFPGGGWYTEILAPLLAAHGKLVVPAYDPDGPADSFDTYLGRGLQLLLDKSPELFGKVRTIPQKAGGPLDLGPDGSADMVLAIREMHNWYRFGHWKDYLEAAHRVLRPGGVLGVVQHRAPEEAEPDQSAQQGYLPEPWLIEAAEAVGFELVDKSELNANPADTKDYPEGVWTLPPSFALGKKDRDAYAAIGESDRMTLKFVKTGPGEAEPAAVTPDGS